MKFKKGDSVIVIAGKDKGAKGHISAVFPSKGKVIIDKVNVAKRHTVARGKNTKSEQSCRLAQGAFRCYEPLSQLACSAMATRYQQ